MRALPVLVLLLAVPSVCSAQFNPLDLIKKEAKHQAMKALAKQLGLEAPTVSSADAVFRTSPTLSGDEFRPTQNTNLTPSRADGSVTLAPGDYEFPVWCTCLKHSAGTSGGHRYLLAPIKGKRAPIIAALYARASLAGIPTWQVQHMSWNLQAGLSYEQLPDNEKAIMDSQLPEFKETLAGSFLDQLKEHYGQLAHAAGLPDFDQAISSGELGDFGKAIGELQQFQTDLVNNNTESGVNSYIRRDPPDATGGPQNTPWSRISDRAYGRIVIQGGAMSPGTLQLRILPGATPDVNVPVTSLEGEPGNPGMQPIGIVPPNPDDISLTKATTTDANSVTVDYTVTSNGQNQPVQFQVYRASQANADSADATPIGGDSIPSAASGSHTIQNIDLKPDPQKPFIIVKATLGGSKSSAYFRKWRLATIAHGYAGYFALDRQGTKAWVENMAFALERDHLCDQAIRFDWIDDSVALQPNMTRVNGARLALQIRDWIAGKRAGHSGDVVDLWMIGHSRGTVVTSQALLNLASQDLSGSYVQVVLLDCHPANKLTNTKEPNGRFLCDYDDAAATDQVPLSGGFTALGYLHHFQEIADDPEIVLPSGKNIKSIDIWWQHTEVRLLPKLTPEGHLNLWGLTSDDRRISNQSGVPINPVNVTTTAALIPGLSIGHDEVHEVYLKQVTTNL